VNRLANICPHYRGYTAVSPHSRGITAEYRGRYPHPRGITATVIPITAINTAVTAALPQSPSPCQSLPQTHISRSGHSLILNICEMAKDTAIVTMEGE